ncbi:Ribosome assembly protein [Yarrowia sp. B02]|nr:Ribosome assembly protein [Yarrowia sp. B02]
MSKRSAEDQNTPTKASKTSEDATAASSAPANPQELSEMEKLEQEVGGMEDRYDDEGESEEEIFEAGDEEDEAMEDVTEEQAQSKALETIARDNVKTAKSVFVPQLHELTEDMVMEPDMSVYEMIHSCRLKWPCLSFDVVPDSLGQDRSSYPHTTYLACGTQAQKPKDNEILVLKISQMGKTQFDEEDESEDEDDADPVMVSKHIPTNSTVNRVRTSPFGNKTGEYLTASMMESSECHIWDIAPQIKSFDVPGSTISKAQLKPIYTVKAHKTEGYAVDWSPLVSGGELLTGDCDGNIFQTSRAQAGFSTASTPYAVGSSVEDLQWSTSEKTVFASGGVDGLIRIWDTRQKQNKAALEVRATNTDINVMSWNHKVSYLLASGHDDGTWGVWDLRSFQKPNPKPVAAFDFHKKAVTSIEFHPTEDSVVAVASEDSTVTLWDLAVEADDDEVKQQLQENGDIASIPPQLLFVHWQANPKEVRWNKQIPGQLVTTGSDGLNLWKSISV